MTPSSIRPKKRIQPELRLRNGWGVISTLVRFSDRYRGERKVEPRLAGKGCVRNLLSRRPGDVTFCRRQRIYGDMKTRGPLEELYRLHAQAVFRFAYGMCRNRVEAEDTVAETFARVVTRAEKIESASARAYLLTVARNVFLDGRRRAARDARMLRDAAREKQGDEPYADETARLNFALQALSELPEGERAALLLRLDHDLSYDDIGKTLGISVAAAKVRVHRARLKLANVRNAGEWDDES